MLSCDRKRFTVKCCKYINSDISAEEYIGDTDSIKAAKALITRYINKKSKQTYFSIDFFVFDNMNNGLCVYKVKFNRAVN